MLTMNTGAIRLAALSLLLLGASGPVRAETAPEAEAGADVAPPSTPDRKRQKLDLLFDRLAHAENKEAENLAAQIQDIWSHSGSDSMDLLLRRGLTAMEEEDYPRARAHLSALTRLAPDFAEGWNAAATLAYLEEDYGRSVADIERAVALEPRHFAALAGLAMILEHVGRTEAALKTWREIERIYPALDRAQEFIERLAPEVDGRGI